MEQKLKIFGEAMQKELLENKQKGKWDNLHPLYLCAELHYHASKLYKACDHGDKAKILEYAADCGNIAMMIADVNGSLVPITEERIFCECDKPKQMNAASGLEICAWCRRAIAK